MNPILRILAPPAAILLAACGPQQQDGAASGAHEAVAQAESGEGIAARQDAGANPDSTGQPVEASTPQAAEDTSPSAVTAEAQKSAQASSQPSSDDDMDAVMYALDDYLQRQGAPAGGGIANRNGVAVEFATGLASAAVPPGSPGFSDARALAFERAFQNALGQLAQRRSSRISSSVVSQLMQNTADAASFVEACKPTADQALALKLTQVLDASLNAALRELQVPEGDITAQRPVFRCENPTLRDAITTRSANRALASLRGARVVKSVAVGAEMGVAVAVSPNFVASAETLARGDAARNPLPDAAQEIAAQFDQLDGKALFAEYGTRMAKLSNGETAIYAFGQAGANLTANDVGAFRSTKRRAAQSSAQRAAEAQLAQFAKVTTYFVGEEERWAELARTMVVEEGAASEEQTQQVGRRMMEQIKSTADLRLEGAMVIKRWNMEDPQSGDLIEGVVLAWSPSLAGGMRQAQRPASSRQQANAPARTGPSQKAESRENEEDW